MRLAIFLLSLIAFCFQNTGYAQKTPPPWRNSTDNGYVPYPGGPKLFEGGVMVGDRLGGGRSEEKEPRLWVTRSPKSALDAELAARGFYSKLIDKKELASKIPIDRACLLPALQFLAPQKDQFLSRFQSQKVLGENPHGAQVTQVTARLTAHYMEKLKGESEYAAREAAALETGVLVKIPTPQVYRELFPETKLATQGATNKAFESDFLEVAEELQKKRPEANYAGNGPWYLTFANMRQWARGSALVFDANIVVDKKNPSPARPCLSLELDNWPLTCETLSTKEGKCTVTADQMTLHHPLGEQLERELALFNEIMASESMQKKLKAAQDRLEKKRKVEVEEKNKNLEAEKKRKEEEKKRQEELRKRKKMLEELGTAPGGNKQEPAI